MSQEQLKEILGQHFVEVFNTLSDPDPNAKVAKVHQAAEYVKNNAVAIAKNKDAAKEILTMIRQAANEASVKDIEPQLSALYKEVMAPEPEPETEVAEPQRRDQVEHKEVETPKELTARLNELIDFFVEELQENKVGSYNEAIIKLDKWEDQIYDLSPQDLQTDEVKNTMNKLNNLKTEITRARMRGIADVPVQRAA